MVKEKGTPGPEAHSIKLNCGQQARIFSETPVIWLKNCNDFDVIDLDVVTSKCWFSWFAWITLVIC